MAPLVLRPLDLDWNYTTGFLGSVGGRGVCSFFIFFFSFLFKHFYLFIHEKYTGKQRPRQREKQAPCREPDAGLDPRTPGSCPEPKADAQLLSHPGAPGLAPSGAGRENLFLPLLQLLVVCWEFFGQPWPVDNALISALMLASCPPRQPV